MHKLVVQFYAAPCELSAFLGDVLRQNLTIVLMKKSPFVISIAASEADFDVSQLQDTVRITILTERPRTNFETSEQFTDAYPDTLYLRVGNLKNRVLEQSWLSAQSTSELVIKRWRKIANIVKRRTSAGIWVVNPKTNASGFYKDFRFTEGALKLFDSGCRIASTGGFNLVYFREPL